MKEFVSPRVLLGAISGVYTWPMPVFNDLRGRLFKGFVAESHGSFPVSFNTYEHFFTESRKNVFRGMHFQMQPHAVAKVISLVRGQALVFLLDTRENSTTYGVVQKVTLSEQAPLSLYIPIGVALGYLILQDESIISYQMDGAFCGSCDAGIDPEVISEFMPIRLLDTIRSERDLVLQSFFSPRICSPCAG